MVAIRRILINCLFWGAVTAVVIAVFHFSRKSDEYKPDISEVGGRKLVYKLAYVPPSSGGLAAEVREVERLLHQQQINHVTASVSSNDEFEIEVPRTEDFADVLRKVKEILETIGRREFRIVANLDDDAQMIDCVLSESRTEEYCKRATALLQVGKVPEVPIPIPMREANCHWYPVGADVVAKQGLDADIKNKDVRLPTGASPLDSVRGCYLRISATEQGAGKGSPTYFVLCREPTGTYVRDPGLGQFDSAKATQTNEGYTVFFSMFAAAPYIHHDLTRKWPPEGGPRHAALLIDGRVRCIFHLIGDCATELPGHFSKAQAEELVTILGKPQLPLAINPRPVRELDVPPLSQRNKAPKK